MIHDKRFPVKSFFYFIYSIEPKLCSSNAEAKERGFRANFKGFERLTLYSTLRVFY